MLREKTLPRLERGKAFQKKIENSPCPAEKNFLPGRGLIFYAEKQLFEKMQNISLTGQKLQIPD